MIGMKGKIVHIMNSLQKVGAIVLKIQSKKPFFMVFLFIILSFFCLAIGECHSDVGRACAHPS